MERKTSFKIAVISDLHVEALDAPEGKDSWLTTSTPDDPYVNPFTALDDLIEEENLSADILLNLGDMTTKASPSAQQYAWKKTEELAKKLKANSFVGTAGNHDVDSRCANSDYDVIGGLQALKPEFPGLDRSYVDQYWSRNYVIHTMDNVRIVNINSCAFHGYCSENDGKPASIEKLAEYRRGRISEHTLNRLKEDLESKDEYEINIAFFHHHPKLIDSYRDKHDYSQMIGGNELIKVLSESNGSNWLIIHGHKHWPSLNYHHSSSGIQVILSAGSLSSKRLHKENMANQFYIIEIESDALSTYNLPIAGTIHTWNWMTKEKWKASAYEEKIPYGAGFGDSTAPKVVAREIEQFISKDGKPYYTWGYLKNQIPSLKYMLPDNIKTTIDILESKHAISTMLKPNAYEPHQLAKK